jgi:hypothetical protein
MVATLPPGTLARAAKPPAAPTSLAATYGLKRALKFGATACIRDATNSRIRDFAASNAMNSSQDLSTLESSSSDKLFPLDVDPVTVTTIIWVGVKMLDMSNVVKSVAFEPDIK